MKKANKLLILLVVALLSNNAFAQTIVYNQSFTSGSTPTTQCTAWTSFLASLSSTYIYTGFNVSGSLNTTGYTCTNGTVAAAIAAAMRTGTATSQTSDGHTWYVGTGCGGGCGGPIVELAVDQGTCACGSVASVRPAINNSNWGGMGTNCGAASQTLIVTFFYQAVTYTGGSPRALTVCQNSGAASINSLLTIADPASGVTETWTVNTPAPHGTVSGFPTTAPGGTSVTPPGTLTYTPAPGFSGIDSFNIKVSDGAANAFCTIIVTVNSSPAGITGTQCVVAGGQPRQLSDGTPGGSWSSSNPAIASVSATGSVSGVATGTAIISYSAPSLVCPAVATVTVNALPALISGSPGVCLGSTSTLSDAGAGTWSSSNPSVAPVGPTGLVTGLSAGTAVVSYVLPSTCMATANVTVNTAPSAITGSAVVCAAGGTTTLSDALGGGTWTSASPSVATIGIGTGTLTGVTAGTALITYTAPTGCTTTTVATVNPLPSPILGSGSVCVGGTTILSDATAGGTWTTTNTAVAGIGVGTGVVSGVVAGSVTIGYTVAATGCRVSVPMVVNSNPAAISGSGNVCTGATTALSDAGGGVWTSSNTSAATVNVTTGLVTGVAPGTTTITYTLGTGCNVSSSILVSPLPTAYLVTGGGSYCAGGAGAHVGLAYGSSGVNYVLYLGGSPVTGPFAGANSGLDFGPQLAAGSYTVVATNAVTGCTGNMSGSATVSVNTPPATHSVTGGGSFCAGSAGSLIGTDGSDIGVNYELFNGPSSVGPLVSGTGSGLSFGTFATSGTYTILATNPVTGCSQWMAGSAVLTVAPSPTLYLVTGGGSYCAGSGGVHVYLGGGSDAGDTYQLNIGGVPVGGAVYSSAGGPIDFGLQTSGGIYTVTGVNGAGCSGAMSGSVTVVVNPLPAVNSVTGGGGYCAGSAGVHVGLSYSTPGISYQLIYGGGTVSTVMGSGSGLDFGAQTAPGIYTATAINMATLCTSNMTGSVTVLENPLPDAFNVVGGGSYCAGGSGMNIGTDASESGISYQLYYGATAVGTPVSGSSAGAGISFGNHTVAGTYTVTAINTISGCAVNGTGSANITAEPLPALHTVTGGGNYCFSGSGVNVGTNGSNLGVIYELMLGGGIVTTMPGTGSALGFGLQTITGTYSVVAIDGVTGCQSNMVGAATIGVDSLPVVFTVTGGGNFCAGSPGLPVGLTGSVTGVDYQLMNGSSTVGAPLGGSGSALNFGVHTAAGLYTVVATNIITGCSIGMSGRSNIVVNALPAAEIVSGGGNYCTGGIGADVELGVSVPGVNYQLYSGGAMIGAPFAGTGDTIDFGMNPAGTYTVKATDTTTGCTAMMSGSAHVAIVTPTIYAVTGGGSFCAGGTGVSAGLGGSSTGVIYALFTGGSLVGSAVSGTGASLSFGMVTTAGYYTVQATDSTLGCTVTMPDSVHVIVNSLPVAETVTGGGSFCAGTTGPHVGLSNSVSGVTYQLYNGIATVGTPLAGISGSSLDFGPETVAGTYTIRATTSLTGCMNNMTGNATVNVLPTPAPYAVTVDNSGNYCAADSGLHVRLANSQSGYSYALYRAATAVGAAITGAGSALDFGIQSLPGSYTVVGINPADGCTANMLGSVNINIVPLPAVHGVTGGGGICSGGSGTVVGQDGSQAGIFYQLYRDGVNLVTTIYGTGAPITFGLQNVPGVYTVTGNSEITTCVNNMYGSAVVYYDTLPQPVISLRTFPAAGVGVWHIDSVRAQVSNAGSAYTFQWYVNGHAIAGATNGLFTSYQLFNNDSVSCTVTDNGPCGSRAASSSVIISLRDVSVSQLSAGSAVISLVPNPNRGQFVVKGQIGNATEDVVAEVTNMLGQVVYKTTLSAQNGQLESQMDMGNALPSGVYHLNLSATGGHAVIGFVVE